MRNSYNMLAPEVLGLVCGFLCKGDLKQVRQVSKIWEGAAVPHLFDQIFISQDMADHSSFSALHPHFGVLFYLLQKTGSKKLL